MKVGKPKSKRVPVRLRHKIQKASASKQRKERKEAKKNPQWKSRMKKDPGIPNLFPYKDKILAEIEDGRRKKEEEAVRRKELARAQRGGVVAAASGTGKSAQEVDGDDEDEVLVEAEDDDEEGDEMDVESNANPMAALLASAQARAQVYTTNDDEDEDEDDEDDEDNENLTAGGVDLPKSHKKPTKSTTTTPSEPKRRPLPAAALTDPVKAVTKLLTRLEATPNQIGLQQLLDHYAIDPLPPASNGVDSTSRFLVDVARKRGRLGRGGVPNLHAAAFTVLGDLNEERLRLPALEAQGLAAKEEGGVKTTTKMAALVAKGRIERGEVQVVTTMAEPFRIEGLFGDD